MNKRKTTPSQPDHEDLETRRHQRFGWTSLCFWLLLGTTLELLHGVKATSYLLDPLRRQFWLLAHFHGATLALVNLVYVHARSAQLSPALRNAASWMLVAGSTLMPLGFFLGGLWHYEGDPGLGIILSPIGALLILMAVGIQVRASWSR